MSGRRKTVSPKKLYKIIVGCIIVVLLFLFVNDKTGLLNLPSINDLYEQAGLAETTQQVNSDFAVHFIDVGQGDSILITANGENMLIDAGENGQEQLVLDYLSGQNVGKLKYVVATHPHSDHIGGLPEVLAAVKTENIIMPKLTQENTPATKTYEALLTAVSQSGAKALAASPGNSYSLGGAEFTVLAPLEQDDVLNNMSVVIRLTYQGKSFLFMGDAEKPVEKQLLSSGCELAADVIKLGHHGSSTSSGKKFIEAVAPQYAVISCGKDNDYGHPHEETLELMTKLGIKVFRTDDAGTIVIGVENSKLIIGVK